MKFQVPEEMQDFVKPTEFCDCDHNEIKSKAEALTKDASSPKGAAMNIFYYVRDFPYAIGRFDVKASKTLKEGKGACVTKTNLQIALLRAIGIPARYHQVVLKKDIIKGIISDNVLKKMDKIWYHPWCECYISGKWIACDLYLDKETYNAALRNNIINKEQMPTIDWDGEHDLKHTTPWLLEDVGTHASYDNVIKTAVKSFPKMPKFLFNWIINKSNRYTEKLRNV